MLQLSLEVPALPTRAPIPLCYGLLAFTVGFATAGPSSKAFPYSWRQNMRHPGEAGQSRRYCVRGPGLMRCFRTGETRVVGSPILYMLGGWRQTCSRSFKDGPWETSLSSYFQSSVFQEHRRRNLLYSCRCRHRVQVGEAA